MIKTFYGRFGEVKANEKERKWKWQGYSKAENVAKACGLWVKPELLVSLVVIQPETKREVGDGAVIDEGLIVRELKAQFLWYLLKDWSQSQSVRVLDV